MLERPIITLTTDFGLKDPFVGIMKGVISGINPDAVIIDISHNIQRHNIFEASQVISLSYKYFPSKTIHVAVIDPGVGGSRRPVLAAAEKQYFVGPDNGIFSSVLSKAGFEQIKVIHLTAKHYFLPVLGPTFHGRDIFAPAAAWLSKGIDYSNFGEEIDDYIKIEIPEPVLENNHTIKGQIVSIDNFGNAISNITSDDIAHLTQSADKDRLKVSYNNMQLPISGFYAENESSSLSAIINSFGNLELFIYRGNASKKFDIKTGNSVIITLV